MSRLYRMLLLVVGLSGCGPGDGPQPGADKARSAVPVPPVASTPAPPPAAAPDTTPHLESSSIQFFTMFAGKTPLEVELWRTKPTAKRLFNLLGAEKYQSFLVNMQDTGVIQEEKGLYYVLGNKKYGGPGERAVFVADPARDFLYVWMMVGGRPEVHFETGWVAPLPKAVRAAIGPAAP